MSLPRPDLVFVAGPQEGERAVLMSDRAIVGRSRTADINITEEFVSRRHLEFTNSSDGWIVQTLSSAGMRINGRKFKPGKKVILATGDVLAIGLQTEILFVSPPDDPEAAIAQYRKAHVKGNAAAGDSDSPVELTLAPNEARSPDVQAPAEPQMPAGSARSGAPHDSERSEPILTAVPEKSGFRRMFFSKTPIEVAAGGDSGLQAVPVSLDEAEQARLRKRVKYAVIFGIYLLILAVVVVVIWQRGAGGIFGPPKEPPILSEKKIEECLATRLKRAKDITGTNAAEALNSALALYENRNIRVGDLYRCVRQFKLYLAYDDLSSCPNIHDDEKYKTARSELTELVRKKYFIACNFEKQFCWVDSKAAFDDLLRVVPEHEQGDPVADVLVGNINTHLNYVSGKIKKK
jgi:hypothetical protein